MRNPSAPFGTTHTTNNYVKQYCNVSFVILFFKIIFNFTRITFFPMYKLEVITNQCSTFNLIKKIEVLAAGIELDFFSLDNCTILNTWVYTVLLHI